MAALYVMNSAYVGKTVLWNLARVQQYSYPVQLSSLQLAHQDARNYPGQLRGGAIHPQKHKLACRTSRSTNWPADACDIQPNELSASSRVP